MGALEIQLFIIITVIIIIYYYYCHYYYFHLFLQSSTHTVDAKLWLHVTEELLLHRPKCSH